MINAVSSTRCAFNHAILNGSSSTTLFGFRGDSEKPKLPLENLSCKGELTEQKQANKQKKATTH